MDPTHKSAVRNRKCMINKSIKLDVLMPHLEESKIFTKAMLDDIKRSETDLFDELPSRGPKAFEKFLKVLEKSGYLGEAQSLSLYKNNITSDTISDEFDYKKPVENDQQKTGNTTASVTDETILYTFRQGINSKTFLPSDDVYKMLSTPRGYCLIINNVDFMGLLEYREGSDEDANRLQKVFSAMGFEVETKRNLDVNNMRKTLEIFSQKKEHANVDSCVIIILSHGGVNDTIHGSDAEKLKLDDVLELFDNTNCENLKGKPKLFFLQACRGRKFDSGVAIESADSGRIPSRTDMLIAFATLSGHVAIRNHVFGSWFCTELASVLLDHASDTDLISMLQKVDRRVKTKMTNVGDKQVTEQRLIGFDKKVYFNPCLK